MLNQPYWSWESFQFYWNAPLWKLQALYLKRNGLTRSNTSKFLQKHTPTHACLAFSLLLLWESLQYVVMTIPMKQHVNGRFFILLILFPIVCNVYQITWALNDHEDCYRLPVLTDWERYVKHNDEAQEINRTLNMNHKRRSRGTLTMKKLDTTCWK